MRTGFDSFSKAATGPDRLHLRLLATTDLHAHLAPWDYLTDRPVATGLAQLAPLIRGLRDGTENCLLLDNGDFLQGSALGDWFARQGRSAVHPMVQAMNALGYDAGTLGNHEFSHGLPLLRAALAAVDFPVVSANLAGRDAPLAPPYVILERQFTDTSGNTRPFRIALTGFAPPQTVKWESLKLKGAVRATDILAAARAILPEIAAHRPDLTIALAHTGIGTAEEGEGMENAALALAALAGIDVLVTGHTHLTFPQAGEGLHGKPAVMAGFHGSHLGVIDLTLARSGAGWRIAAHEARALPAPPLPQGDPQIGTIALPAHHATQQWLARPLGRTERPLHSHFALLAPSAARSLVASAQAEHMRPEIPPALSHLPLLSAVASFRTGGRGGPANFTDIPAGPLLQRHASDLYLHPNTPVLLLVSGADVTDWLERAVILFNRIAADSRDTPLIRADLPGFDCDLIDGLSFAIDLSQPPRFDAGGALIDPDAHRILAPSVRGLPLRPDDRFLLVTNSYRAGSGVYPAADRPPVAGSNMPIRDILAAHIATHGLPPAPAETWGFSPLNGATVTFDTSPAATRHLPDIAHLRPEPLGPTGSGFLRFRLTL